MKPISSISINTQELPLEKRNQHWLTNVNNHIIELDALDTSNSAIDASLKQYDLGDIKLNHIKTNAHGVQRSISNISHDSREKIMLSLILQGGGFACQGVEGGQHLQGSAVIYSSFRPYALAFPDPVEMLVIAIPRQILVDEFGSWEQKNLVKLDQNMQMSGFGTTNFYKSIGGFYAGNLSAQDTVSQMLENLDGLINQRSMTTANRNLYSLLIKSKKYIEANLQNENLSVEVVSKKLHTSTRQLARAFALDGNTLTRYLWSKRLEKCRHEILDPHSQSNLSEIAFRWGFNHPAHFSRSYKQHFGESPTQTRQNLV